MPYHILKSKSVVTVALLTILGCGGRVDYATMSPEAAFSDPQVTSLTSAALAGDVAKADALVRQGVNVNARGLGNITPLLFCLLKHKESMPTFSDLGKLRFESDEKRKWWDGYQALLRHGADPNLLDDQGQAVILLVANESHAKWLQQALAHRGNPNLVNKGNKNSPNTTPLFYAIGFDLAENVRLLVRAGANLEHEDYCRLTPLHSAIDGCHWECAYVLLEAGADYRHKNKFGQDTANTIRGYSERNRLDATLKFQFDDYQRKWLVKLIESLNAKGANIKFRD